jgi:extradiol dioxygenase family protein
MTPSSKHRTTPKLIGPSFIALQVRDLEASKTFYVEQIGLTASPHNPPGVVLFIHLDQLTNQQLVDSTNSQKAQKSQKTAKSVHRVYMGMSFHLCVSGHLHQ